MQKVVFEGDVCISNAICCPGRCANLAEDCQQRRRDPDLRILEQTKVEFEICSVLFETRKRSALQLIKFVAELEVKLSPWCDIGIVGDEGLL